MCYTMLREVSWQARDSRSMTAGKPHIATGRYSRTVPSLSTSPDGVKLDMSHEHDTHLWEWRLREMQSPVVISRSGPWFTYTRKLLQRIAVYVKRIRPPQRDVAQALCSWQVCGKLQGFLVIS